MGELGTTLPQGVLLTPLKIIPTDNGDVLHGLKATDQGFISFGEAYFSTVGQGKKKGWKKHTRMTLNLIVTSGAIGFILFDDRADSATQKELFKVNLSRDNYQRLTVPPGIWVAFSGESGEENMLLNIASIQHDPTEAVNLPIENDYIRYSWQ
jgi:dTDP-4-dehydrorhamnose 3,5-epimerase